MIYQPTSYGLANGEIFNTETCVRTTFCLHNSPRDLTLTCIQLKGIEILHSDRWARN
jgi:hypothetical protein